MPTLKAPDRIGVVISLDTFANILFPSPQLGFLSADQQVTRGDGQGRTLAEELSKIKSFLSVSTSALLQAIAGGLLLAHNCSFRELIEPKARFYQANRDCMLESLAGQVRWSRPGGGIFLTVDLPLAFNREQLHLCAEHYGVICCPSQEEIRTGSARFAAFVRAQIRLHRRTQAIAGCSLPGRKNQDRARSSASLAGRWRDRCIEKWGKKKPPDFAARLVSLCQRESGGLLRVPQEDPRHLDHSSLFARLISG